MDELVLEILIRILLSCKTDDSFSIDIDPERIDRCHHDKDPHIEFQIVDQIRVVDVGLHD